MALVALPFTTGIAGSRAMRASEAELSLRHSAQLSAAGPVSTSASSASSCCGDLRHSARLSSRNSSARRTSCYASEQACSPRETAAVEDWYQVLGVERTATAKEVKAAYRQLVRKFHPDVVAEQDKQDSTSRFLQVHQAYAVLSDPQAKAAFDLHLSMSRFQTLGYATAWRRYSGVSASSDFVSGYAGSSSSSSSVSSSSTTSPYFGNGAGYAYGFGYSASSSAASQGSTSYATASYPTMSTPSSQWKGKSWETDQCW